MAEGSGDKTHAPTPKRIDDARKRGDTPQAPELRQALGLAAALGGAGWLGDAMITDIGRIAASLWGNAAAIRVAGGGAQALAAGLLGTMAITLAPLFTLLVAGALLSGFGQGMPTLAPQRLAPKWSKISPVGGLKRLFGPAGLVEFAKAILKCAAVVTLAWMVMAPSLAGADRMVGLAPGAILAVAADLSFRLLKWLALAVGLIALADLAWQRRAFFRKLRMSVQELKDEHKESDGNPEVKLRQRQIAAARTRQRIAAAVPTASVVITNPTHFAVALRYEHGAMRAPIVVAKGADRVALRIREIAREHAIPLVESKPLARALYAQAEVDRPIPIEQYAAVAEVISFVMRQARQLRG